MISIPPRLSPPLPHTAVNETVCWSQTNADGLPGAGRWERARRAAWHFWCKHVACWRAKSLVGGLYLFFKELVRFVYTRQRLRVLEERGGNTFFVCRVPASPALGVMSWGSWGLTPRSRSKGQWKRSLQGTARPSKHPPLPAQQAPPWLFSSVNAKTCLVLSLVLFFLAPNLCSRSREGRAGDWAQPCVTPNAHFQS